MSVWMYSGIGMASVFYLGMMGMLVRTFFSPRVEIENLCWMWRGFLSFAGVSFGCLLVGLISLVKLL